MYFWKIKELKKDLKESGLSQKKMFLYILIYAVLAQIVVELSYVFPQEEPELIDYLQILFNVVVVGFGTYFCFYANGKNSGKDFAERYFSIGLVVGIRFIALLTPVTFVFGVTAGILNVSSGIDIDGPMFDYILIAIMSVWLVAMYWRMSKHIKDVAKVTHA